jgi:hypothetical protein
MNATNAQLRVGGFVLPDVQVSEDIPVDLVDARAFVHPGLPAREIVRLTPRALALGEDAAMDTLGFSLQDVASGIAIAQQKSLGFPNWVLVHAPKDAAQALAVARSFRKESRKASSKPGAAKSAFDGLIADVSKSTPHFLPTLCEEMGRTFMESGNTSYAAMFFGKARDSEQKYALEIDEERRRAVFLEFTLAGAVTGKSMTEYAKDLARRHGDSTAYDFWVDICVRRTLGGNPPTSAMFKDLKRLSKAAGLKPEVGEDAVLSQIWQSPSLGRAPAPVWKDLRAAFVRLAKVEKDLPSHLLGVFPHALRSEDGFGDFWIEVLQELGAIEELEGRKNGGIARWFSVFIAGSRSSSWYGRQRFPEAGFALVTRFAGPLAGDQVPVVVGGDDWGEDADLDLLDLLLELGITVDPGKASFDLRQWMQAPEESHVYLRDLSFVAAHGSFGVRLGEAVASVIDDQDFHVAAQGKAGLSQARERWLMERLAALQTGSVAAFGRVVSDLVDATNSSTFLEFPVVWDALQNLDLVAPLQTTLKRGFLGEFDWPAARKAASELANGKEIEGSVSGVFPNLVLHNEKRALVVNGEKRVFEHDFKLKKGDEVQDLRFVNGQLLVNLYDDDYDRLAYWSSNPKKRFEGDYMYSGPDFSVHRSDGSVVEGKRAYRAGEETIPSLEEFWSDGQTFWATKSWDDPKVYEFDPETGEEGRASLPKVVEDILEDGWVLNAHASKVYPAPETSPHGTVDGVYFKAIFEKGDESLTKTPLGLAPQSVSSLIRLPGGEIVELDSDFEILALDGTLLDASEAIPGLSLEFEYFHHFQVTDENASLKLRGIDVAGAASLLSAAINASPTRAILPEKWVMGGSTTPLAAVIKNVIGTSPLESALARLVESHMAHITSLAQHIRGADPRFAVSAENSIPDSEVWASFESVTSGGEYSFNNETYDDERELSTGIVAMAEFFKNGAKPAVFANYSCDFSWVFRFPKVLPWVASGPWISGSREALLKFIDAVADAGLFELADDMTIFKSSQKSWVKHGIAPETRAFFVEHESTRFCGKCGEYEDETYSILAYSTGKITLPAGIKANDQKAGVAWSAGPAKRFVELSNEHGPYTPSREAAETIAELTGLSVAEASTLWAMLPNVNEWYGVVMDTELRKSFKLKAAELNLAREALKEVPGEKRCAVYAEALPDDLEEFWTAPIDVAKRLAASWNRHVGRRQALPEDLLVAMQKDLSVNNARTSLLSLYSVPVFKVGGIIAYDSDDKNLAFEMGEGVPDSDFIAESLHVFPYLFYNLPVGDPTRQKVADYYEALAKSVFAADALLPTSTEFEWIDDKKKSAAMMAKLGANKTMKGVSYFDDGFVVFLLGDWGLEAAIRPAQLMAGKTSPYIVADNLEAQVLRAFSGMKSLVDRLKGSQVSAGEYEANPLHSSLETVAQVKKELGVSEEAAIAFLQTLAMPNPSTKQIRLWNGWSAATYKKAFAPLVEKGVLIEAKRARAGRSFFLDGPWLEFRSPHIPMEAWKVPMMPLLASDQCQVRYPISAPHELFEQAWTRWRSGDKPGFTK